jgi:hypothetical protein
MLSIVFVRSTKTGGLKISHLLIGFNLREKSHDDFLSPTSQLAASATSPAGSPRFFHS